MTAFTLYEYDDIGVTKEPRFPYLKKTTGTVGTPVVLQLTTAYIEIVPAADMWFEFSVGKAQTAAVNDHKILAGVPTGCEVKPGATNYVNTTDV